MRTLLLALMMLLLTGCALMKTIPDRLDRAVGGMAAGVYDVEIKKDGRVLLIEHWRCDQGPDGKLAGCHQLEKEPQ